MSANFDWNKIPGMHSSAEQGDHFDTFFNAQRLTPGQGIQQRQNQTGSDSNLYLSSSGNKSTDTGPLNHVLGNLRLNNLHPHNSMDNIASMNSSAPSIPPKPTAQNPTLDATQAVDLKLHASSTDTIIAQNDSSLVLSVKSDELTPHEVKTYHSWYQTITRRKSRFADKSISIDDVLKFLGNFGISEATKERMKILFGHKANSLNITQFFALMRLIAHAVIGEPLTSSLVKIPASVPRPISIMAKTHKRIKNKVNNTMHKDNRPKNDEKHKLDINSFTEMLLTGQTPSSSSIDEPSAKRVKFSEVVTFSPPPMTQEDYDMAEERSKNEQKTNENVIDYSMPMDQLLERLKQQQQNTTQPVTENTPAASSSTEPATENEEEILKDIKIDSFQSVTHLDPNSGNVPQPLKPNLTGSASKSIKEHFMQQFDQTFKFDATPQADADTGNINSMAANNNAYQTPVPQLLSIHSDPGISTNPLSQSQPQNSHSQQPDSGYFGMYPEQNFKNNALGDLYNSLSSPSSPRPKGNNMPSSGTALPWTNSSRTVSPPAPPPRQTNDRPRSSSLANGAPPLPPPPPVSRKLSRASQFSPPPNASELMHPNLPPKPALNEQQKQKYLTSSSLQQQQQQQQQQQMYMNAMQQQQYYYMQQQAQQQQMWPSQSPQPQNNMPQQQQQQTNLPPWPSAPW